MNREIIYRYCPECTGEMKEQIIFHGPARRVCSRCGLIIHPDPKVAAAGLVIRDDQVLLVRRAKPPQKEFWCLPGGFVDRGETLEQAAVRETLEETGFIVTVENLFGLYSYPGYPIVVAIYVLNITGGQLTPNRECLEALWFSRGDLPWDKLAFPSTRDSLSTWAGVTDEQERFGPGSGGEVPDRPSDGIK